MNDVLDARQVIGELAPHVVLVELQLPFDVFDRYQIVGQHGQPVGGGLEIALGEVFGDPERVEQLEPDAALFIQGGDDVVFEILEVAGGPEAVALGWVAVAHLLRLLGEEGGNREDLRIEPQQPVDALAHELHHLFLRRVVAQQVGFVQDNHDLLAPLPDLRHELAFGFGEGTVGRGDEEHQVGTGHKPLGERFVLPNDGVGAGGVDNSDLFQERRWPGPLDHAIGQHRFRGFFPVAQEIDHRGRRNRPLRHDRVPDQGVDERRLPGIELADNDQQEKLVQRPGGLREFVAVVLGGRKGIQRGDQALQDSGLCGEEVLLLAGKDRSVTGAFILATKSENTTHAVPLLGRKADRRLEPAKMWMGLRTLC